MIAHTRNMQNMQSILVCPHKNCAIKTATAFTDVIFRYLLTLALLSSLTGPVFIISLTHLIWHCPSTGNCCNDSFVTMYEGKGNLSATTPNHCSFSFLIERWPAPQFFAISNGFKATIALFKRLNVSVFSFEQTRHFQTSKWRLCCIAQKIVEHERARVEFAFVSWFSINIFSCRCSSLYLLVNIHVTTYLRQFSK